MTAKHVLSEKLALSSGKVVPDKSAVMPLAAMAVLIWSALSSSPSSCAAVTAATDLDVDVETPLLI
jgi:hypothetical protein